MKRIVGPLLIAAFAVVIWRALFGGNPGGIPDEKYARYKALHPPKLLYSCTRQPSPEWLLQLTRNCAHSGRSGCDEAVRASPEAQPQSVVEFAGSDGGATYEQLLTDAKRHCAMPRGNLAAGRLEILEADKD